MICDATTPQVTALILAGGEGRRLGGQDKGWIEFRGIPLIQTALEKVRSQTSNVVISANRNLARYRSLGVPVVADLTTEYEGPASGILAGALQSETEWLWILPVDCPHAEPLTLDRLRVCAERSGADLVVAHDGNREQHLFMLLNRAAQARLLNYFLAGGRSIKGWLQTQSYGRADCADIRSSFFNVNEPSDLDSAMPR